ncbi:MAG: hypothetical protein WAX69_03270 [Victivallales bacterium]
MYIQRMRRRTAKGGYFYHWVVTEKGGRRKYLPRARLASVEAQIEIEKRSRAMLRAIQDTLKTGGSGRPPILNAEIRTLLTAAGYTVRSDKICRSRKRFFTQEAVELRYDLLDDDLKIIIKSPANLATLEHQSMERLMSYAGRGKPGKTFDSSFTEVLAESNRKTSR